MNAKLKSNNNKKRIKWTKGVNKHGNVTYTYVDGLTKANLYTDGMSLQTTNLDNQKYERPINPNAHSLR